jgi:hypothetical protein
MHQERAALADSLSTLTDPEIMAKITESPKRLKKRSQQLLHKLDKLGVTLDKDGFVDYSNVTFKKELKILKDNEILIKTVLMERDLEFEYPHKLGKLLPPIDRPVSSPPSESSPPTHREYYNIDPSGSSSP